MPCPYSFDGLDAIENRSDSRLKPHPLELSTCKLQYSALSPSSSILTMVQELNFQGYSDRLPPQNIDAEEAILGGILLDPEAIGRVMEILRPDAFYISTHQEIYRAALALQTQGKPTDLMSITSWLHDNGLLEKVGGQGR